MTQPWLSFGRSMSSIDEDESAERQPATPRKRKRWSPPRVILSELAVTGGFKTYDSVEAVHPTFAA
jgi:hypothetical protein